MVPRTISSAWTPFYKFVFPVIWLGLMGFVGFAGGREILPSLVPLLVVGLVGHVVFVAPLKIVRLDDSALYVSNHRREIRIAFSQVEKVTGPWFTSRLATIHFRAETEFGRKVTFMPTMQWLNVLGPHPIVGELQDLVRRK